MLRRSYDWVMRLSASRHAVASLAALAFAEGLFFPVPPDVLLMPLVLARRDRAWTYAAICLIASVIGGSIGYAVGYFLSPVGAWLIAVTGGDAAHFQHWYGQWGVLLLALPIPYKVMAIASGMFRLNYLVFLLASLLIRGLRFFLVAGLVRAYGAPIQAFVERRMAVVVAIAAVVVVSLVLAVRLLH